MALKTEAIQLRFWGKILGTQKDYYVAEGRISNKYIDDFPREYEPKGTGVNRLSFWVTDNGKINKKTNLFIVFSFSRSNMNELY